MDEQCLVIDSRFRNLSYPNQNSYTVFLNSPMYNITRAELVTAFLPPLVTPDRYVFLDIDEFRSKFGSHVCVSNASYQSVIVSYNPDGSYVTSDIKYNNPVISGYFAHVFYGNTVSSNLVYTEQTSYRSSVTFQQPIESLKQLTIRWIDRFNQPVAFLKDTDHTFALRLYTKRPTIQPIPPPVEDIAATLSKEKKIKPEDAQTLAAMVTGIFIFLMTALT